MDLVNNIHVANNIGGKTADGLQAVMWRTRDMYLLRQYNREDVRQLAVLCAMPSIELPYNKGHTDAACLSAAVYAWSRIGGPLGRAQDRAHRKGSAGGAYGGRAPSALCVGAR